MLKMMNWVSPMWHTSNLEEDVKTSIKVFKEAQLRNMLCFDEDFHK